MSINMEWKCKGFGGCHSKCHVVLSWSLVATTSGYAYFHLIYAPFDHREPLFQQNQGSYREEAFSLFI